MEEHIAMFTDTRSASTMSGFRCLQISSNKTVNANVESSGSHCSNNRPTLPSANDELQSFEKQWKFMYDEHQRFQYKDQSEGNVNLNKIKSESYITPYQNYINSEINKLYAKKNPTYNEEMHNGNILAVNGECNSMDYFKHDTAKTEQHTTSSCDTFSFRNCNESGEPDNDTITESNDTNAQDDLCDIVQKDVSLLANNVNTISPRNESRIHPSKNIHFEDFRESVSPTQNNADSSGVSLKDTVPTDSNFSVPCVKGSDGTSHGGASVHMDGSGFNDTSSFDGEEDLHCPNAEFFNHLMQDTFRKDLRRTHKQKRRFKNNIVRNNELVRHFRNEDEEAAYYLVTKYLKKK